MGSHVCVTGNMHCGCWCNIYPKDYQYYVVCDGEVKSDGTDLVEAKDNLNQCSTTYGDQRMIVEYLDGKLVIDPHKVGPNDEDQGAGQAAGFNKFWWDWNSIKQMQAIACTFRTKVECPAATIHDGSH